MKLRTWWRDATHAAAGACARALQVAVARGRAALVYGQSGQSMVEYAIVGALVAIVAMIALQAFGIGVGQVFANMTGKISGLGK